MLGAEETRALLDHIDVNTITGLRGRVLIGVIVGELKGNQITEEALLAVTYGATEQREGVKE